MAYQALYRKYRPQTFSDVIGQEHITETLKNELSAGKTVHAYLFTGTRGTGKTSCAKILAKAVNCLDPKDGDPCLECQACRMAASGENTDIVEIDAASNNGVDNIRELREKVNFTPSVSKYRVYIIDEVHMLSTDAFNALLKTLEEPPAHVIFILATTEVHMLPATILSRCQRFDFRRIDPDSICDRIQYIAEKEGFTVTPDAARLIAAAADGGMRDALSILDLCISNGSTVDEKTVENVCGMAGTDYLSELADCIRAQDAERALTLTDRLYSESVDMTRLIAGLISHYRDLMIIKTVKSAALPIVCSARRLEKLKEQAADYELRDIMRSLSALQSASALMQRGNRRCEMEMTLIKLCSPYLSSDVSSLELRVRALERAAYSAPAPQKRGEPVNAAAEARHIEESGSESIAGGDTAYVSPEAAPSDAGDDIPLPEPPEPSEAPEMPEPPELPGQSEPAVQEKDGSAGQKVKDSDSLAPVKQWRDVVEILKTSCPLIAGVLKDSSAYIKGQYLLIDAPNSQFRSLINSGGVYRDRIRAAARTVLGETYKLGPYTPPKQTEESDPLAALADKLKNLEIN